MNKEIFCCFYANDKVSSFMSMVFACYVLFYFLLPDFSKIFLIIFLLISFPLFYFRFKFFKKDPFFLFFLIAIVVQVLSWFSSLIFFSDIANDLPKMDRLSKLFSFLFVAYWLKGSKKYSLIILSFFIVGFITSILISNDFHKDFIRGLNGFRVDFELKNAQFTSMLSGVSILFIMFLTVFTFNMKSKFKWLLLFLLSLSYLLAFFILITSQSRQIWLGIIIALIFLPLLVFYYFKSISVSNLFFIPLFFSIFIFIFIFSNINIVKNRVVHQTLAKESEIIEAMLAGDFDNIPSKKNGIRINSWIESFCWIKENPFFGAGPNSIGEVIMQSDKFTDKQKKRIGHLHSFHLEILVAYGILGALVIYGMYYWLIRSLVLAHRENPELKMYTVLGICFLIFWIIINFFESFSSRSYGVYVHNIMFGCLYTFYFTQQRKKIEEAEACA